MSKTLWCVHVYGPDDLLACASRKDAVQNALWLNLSGYKQQNTDDELMPVAWAVPEPWLYDRQSWSDCLAEQDSDDARWTGEETKVRLLAGELFDFTEDGRPIDWAADDAEAEKRGAVKALMEYASHLEQRPDYRDQNEAIVMRTHARRIESGEVTIP
jgi:hypothetical protein